MSAKLTDRGSRVIAQLCAGECDPTGIGAAQPRGRFGHCVEHRLQVKRRAADDVEHIAGRGLVFERLVALDSAFGKLTLQIGYELLAIG